MSRIVLSLVLLVPMLSGAQSAGMLDGSFGLGGVVFADFGNSNTVFEDLEVVEDGGIVVVGYTGDWMTAQTVVTKYDQYGNPDLGFGTIGIADSLPFAASFVRSVSEDQNGRLLVTGRSDRMFVARYEADGGLDANFGVGGFALADSLMESTAGRDVGVDGYGRIVVLGSTGVSMCLWRFDSNGVLDSTYAQNGRLVVDSWGAAYPRKLIVNSDGSHFVSGGRFNGISSESFIAKVDSMGLFDQTWDMDGVVVIDLEAWIDNYNSIAIDESDRIVAVGSMGINAGQSISVVSRFMSNGTLDTTFGSSGHVLVNSGGLREGLSDVRILGNGLINVVGTLEQVGNDMNNAILLMRLNEYGELDLDYGDEGIVLSELDSTSEASSLSLQSDGKVVVCGSVSVDAFNSSRGVVARYGNDAVGVAASAVTVNAPYPNPVSVEAPHCYVPCGSGSSGRLHDFQGRLIKSYVSSTLVQNGNGLVRFDLSDVGIGVYNLIIEDGVRQILWRLVIQ